MRSISVANEKKKEDVPVCQCPYKQDNNGKCHEGCLIYQSAMRKKK